MARTSAAAFSAFFLWRLTILSSSSSSNTYTSNTNKGMLNKHTHTHKFPDVVEGKNKRKLTLFASSSALCLAVLETDLSDNNRARRNSIVMLDSSMPAFFLVNTTNKENDNNPNKILNPKFKIFKQVWHVQ